MDKFSYSNLSPIVGISLNGVATVATPAVMPGRFAAVVKNSTFGN